MVFINSMDDPIVPPVLLEIVRDAAVKNSNMIYVEQKFGGHLGFYEGGFFYSNPLTWQDRMVIHIAHALVADEGKPAVEQWQEQEEEQEEKQEKQEQQGLEVAVHRVESSGSEDEVRRRGKVPNLKLDCFHTGIS